MSDLLKWGEIVNKIIKQHYFETHAIKPGCFVETKILNIFDNLYHQMTFICLILKLNYVS